MRYDTATRVKPLSAVRLRLLCFSTGDVLAQELSRALAAAGLQAEIANPGFGLVVPELLAPSGETPDAVVILTDAAGFFSRDWRQPTEAAQGLLAERTEAFVSALETFLASSSAPVIVNSLPSAVAPQVGIHDLHHPDGASYLVRTVNRRLQELAARHPRLMLIDADLALAHIAPAHCQATADPGVRGNGDNEGCLRLHELPTPAQAEAIRKVLKIRKRVEYSPEVLARRVEQMAAARSQTLAARQAGRRRRTPDGERAQRSRNGKRCPGGVMTPGRSVLRRWPWVVEAATGGEAQRSACAGA